MRSEDINILTEVFCDVMETSSFMFAAEMGDKIVNICDPIMAKVSFKGEVCSGAVTIVMGKELCRCIVANTLGIDEDDEVVVGQEDDAIGEMVNVLCGQFITKVEGNVPVFHLSIPEITQIDKDYCRRLMMQSHTSLSLVDDIYEVILKLDI